MRQSRIITYSEKCLPKYLPIRCYRSPSSKVDQLEVGILTEPTRHGSFGCSSHDKATHTGFLRNLPSEQRESFFRPAPGGCHAPRRQNPIPMPGWFDDGYHWPGQLRVKLTAHHGCLRRQCVLRRLTPEVLQGACRTRGVW